MNILVDENVPYGKEAFSIVGEVTTAPGRSMTPAMLAKTDALVVRSITKVNAELLTGAPVRFVGTCTIGEDHVDKAWLAEQGIAFSSAPGCNANSVGQYITAALVHLSEKHGIDLQGKRLGIVGVGNVGKRVLQKATALGLECVLNDPPLAEATGDARYRPLEELMDCDFITLHVPIEKGGRWPTYHLANADFLARMKPDAFLINSSRGPVVDNTALEAALREEHLAGAVLDVWEGEPIVRPKLMRLLDIGTPHIAGYSFDGKVNGTRQIFEALCAALDIDATWDPAPLLPTPECPEITLDAATEAPVYHAVKKVYDISRDDAALRKVCEIPEADRAAFFDQLRKQYPRRREFFNTRVRLNGALPEAAAQLAGIGFQVV